MSGLAETHPLTEPHWARRCARRVLFVEGDRWSWPGLAALNL